jgi:hypothetical protein
VVAAAPVVVVPQPPRTNTQVVSVLFSNGKFLSHLK